MNNIKQISFALMLFFSVTLQAQKFSETVKEERQFPSLSTDNLLVVNNVYGSVIVEGYNGDTVKVEGEIDIEANNQRQLDQGKAEVKVKVETYKNIIYVYLDSPYTKFDLETGRYSHSSNWNQVRYNYTLDFNIKVPKNTSVELSAINDGEIKVSNIDAKTISANNINGPITLENVAGKTDVNALNKDINITYSKNPTEESIYNALNGDVTITMQKGLNADISFKSLNDDIYTNMETKVNPSKAKINKKEGRRGTKYKVNSNTQFSIGNGGVQLNFDLLNGDVTIKE